MHKKDVNYITLIQQVFFHINIYAHIIQEKQRKEFVQKLDK